MEIKVQLKQAGKREHKIQTAKLILKQKPENIEELIRFTVSATYHTYQQKKKRTKQFEAGEIDQLIILSEEEIEDAAAGGKVGFDFLHGNAEVTEKEAIESAFQAFEDGLIAIFIDRERLENLSDKIDLTGSETLTFVKLTMLTGRLW